LPQETSFPRDAAVRRRVRRGALGGHGQLRAGLRAGDVLETIDGRPFEEFFREPTFLKFAERYFVGRPAD